MAEARLPAQPGLFLRAINRRTSHEFACGRAARLRRRRGKGIPPRGTAPASIRRTLVGVLSVGRGTLVQAGGGKGRGRLTGTSGKGGTKSRAVAVRLGGTSGCKPSRRPKNQFSGSENGWRDSRPVASDLISLMLRPE